MSSTAFSFPRLLGPLPLLDAYLLRQMARPSLACLGVTLCMMLLERSLRLISEISASGIQVDFFFDLMANLVPYYVGLALPAAFFISMFMVIGRLDDGSELDAMLASGRSIARLAAPLVGIGVVLGAVSLLVFGFIEPHGQFGFRAVQSEALKAGWSGQLQSRVFVSPDKRTTLSADDAGVTGRSLRKVFMSRLATDGTETVVTAQSGEVRTRPAGSGPALALGQGVQISDGPRGPPRVLRFANIVFDTPAPPILSPPVRGRDTHELVLTELADRISAGAPEPERRKLEAEFYARMGRALSLPFLPLLAIPLAMARKRGRRAPGLIVAAVVLICFHHGIQLVASLTSRGGLQPIIGIGGLFALFCSFNSWLFLSSLKRPGETPLAGMLSGIGELGAWVSSLIRRLRTAPRRGASRIGLSGYVGRLLLVRVGTATAVIVSLLQIIELLERTGPILDRGVGLPGLGYYALLQMPVMTQQALGFAMFIGSVFTFMHLASSSEMTAMRAAGLSLRQVLLMVLPVALLFSAFDLVVADLAAPRAQQELRAWLANTAPKGAEADTPLWFRKGADIVRVEHASTDGARLRGVRIYRRSEKGDLSERVTANEATPAANGWRLSEPSSVTLGFDSAKATKVSAALWATDLRPAEIAELQKTGFMVSSGTSIRSLAGAAANQSPSVFVTRLNRVFAEPLGLLVMLLLAAPLALSRQRGSNLPLLLYGIGGGLFYLVADGLMTVWGQVGVLPPVLAAWGAPAAFAAAALTVLFYAEA